ncbi:MAG: hypothetical protein R2932_20420 [Caldilineaceae bacterium]
MFVSNRHGARALAIADYSVGGCVISIVVIERRFLAHDTAETPPRQFGLPGNLRHRLG